MLSVVIPATDEPADAGALPRRARALDEPHAVEVVTRAARQRARPRRATPASRAASGEIVVFVDADVEVHPDALRRLRERARRATRASTPSSAPTTTAPPRRSVVSRFRNLLHHHVHASAPGPATTFWAGLGAIRREAFDAVGGFDARRYPRPSIEDIELGMRLHAAGRRIVLDPAVRGTHLKRWTLRSMLRTDLAARGAPWVALRSSAAAPGRRAEPRLAPAARGAAPRVVGAARRAERPRPRSLPPRSPR